MNNPSELKSTLTDFANALFDANEKANSDIVWDALDYIEILEDRIEELRNLDNKEEDFDPAVYYDSFREI